MKQLVETEFRESVSSYMQMRDLRGRYLGRIDTLEKELSDAPDTNDDQPVYSILSIGVQSGDVGVQTAISRVILEQTREALNSIDATLDQWACSIKTYSGHDPRNLKPEQLVNLQPKPQYRDLTVAEGFEATGSNLGKIVQPE